MQVQKKSTEYCSTLLRKDMSKLLEKAIEAFWHLPTGEFQIVPRNLFLFVEFALQTRRPGLCHSLSTSLSHSLTFSGLNIHRSPSHPSQKKPPDKGFQSKCALGADGDHRLKPSCHLGIVEGLSLDDDRTPEGVLIFTKVKIL